MLHNAFYGKDSKTPSKTFVAYLYRLLSCIVLTPNFGSIYWFPESQGHLHRPPPNAAGIRCRQTPSSLGPSGLHHAKAGKSRSRQSSLRTRYAMAKRPLARAVPRAPSALERSSPSTTAATTGRSSSICPPRCRKTQSFLSILETRSRHPPRYGKRQEKWSPTMDSCIGARRGCCCYQTLLTLTARE
jgi:hypothetical protein